MVRPRPSSEPSSTDSVPLYRTARPLSDDEERSFVLEAKTARFLALLQAEKRG